MLAFVITTKRGRTDLNLPGQTTVHLLLSVILINVHVFDFTVLCRETIPFMYLIKS